jgi:hypothetical protein
MRSFIESVRRKALVVYIGSVKEVRVLQPTKFDIKAEAVVDVKTMIRTTGSNPQQASIEYSSYDEKMPMLEGWSSISTETRRLSSSFANSFDARIPRGCLVQGNHHELLQRVDRLRDTLSKMSPDLLKANEITEEHWRVQTSLYEKLSTSLRAAK